MNEEIILNLWYVYDELGMIYSLRARCYIGTGTEDEKLAMLRQFAATDYQVAQFFPVPERFHTTFHEGDKEQKLAVIGLDSVESIGGMTVLFEDVFVAMEEMLPANTKLSIGRDPLICITPLLAGENNQFHPQTSRRKAL